MGKKYKHFSKQGPGNNPFGLPQAVYESSKPFMDKMCLPGNFKPRKGKRALLSPFRQPIYDTEIYPAAQLISEMVFMNRPLGQNTAHQKWFGNGPAQFQCKDQLWTNMLMCGCLPNPSEFYLYGFAVEYVGPENLKKLVKETGLFEFVSMGNRVLLQIPLTQIQEQVSTLRRPVYNGDLKVPADLEKQLYGRILAGDLGFWPDPEKSFQFYTNPDQYIHIESMESFNVRIRHPSGNITLPQSLEVRVFMDGVMWMPV